MVYHRISGIAPCVSAILILRDFSYKKLFFFLKPEIHIFGII